MSAQPQDDRASSPDLYGIESLSEALAPRPQQRQSLPAHHRQTSLGDPISIAIQSPSTANLSPQRYEQGLDSPSYFPQTPLEGREGSLRSVTRGAAYDHLENQFNPPGARLSSARVVEDESSTSSRRRNMGHAPIAREPFTAIDPFARRKHRLSWSSILSTKDKKRVENPPAAWTTKVVSRSLQEEDEALSTDGIYPGSIIDEPLHGPLPPTSLPISGSDAGSIHPSWHSSSSSYKSFEDDRPERVRKTATFQNVPSIPNGDDRYPASIRKQHTIETIQESVHQPPQGHELAKIPLLRYLPTRMYLYFLLGVPGLYFTRVATVFEDANVPQREMEDLVLQNATARMYPELMPANRNPAFKRLTKSWTHFIDTLIREWKTFNLISVLLLSAIVAILQIEPAFKDPVVHYSALFSLISALMSLLFGCMYILRFNTMRMPHKAIQWAQETQKLNTNMFWNVWILLAIPAVWLVWSLMFYILCIMAFVWRVESKAPPPDFSDELVLAIRIGISTALFVGFTYGFVVLRTFINFGAPMDERFKERLKEYRELHTSKASIRRTDTFQSRPPTIRGRDSPTPSNRNSINASLYGFGMWNGSIHNVAQPAGNVHPGTPITTITVDKPARVKDSHVHFSGSTNQLNPHERVVGQPPPPSLTVVPESRNHGYNPPAQVSKPPDTKEMQQIPVIQMPSLPPPAANPAVLPSIQVSGPPQPRPARRIVIPHLRRGLSSPEVFENLSRAEEGIAIEDTASPGLRPTPPKDPSASQEEDDTIAITIRKPTREMSPVPSPLHSMQELKMQPKPKDLVESPKPDTVPLSESSDVVVVGPFPGREGTSTPFECLWDRSSHPVPYKARTYSTASHLYEAMRVKNAQPSGSGRQRAQRHGTALDTGSQWDLERVFEVQMLKFKHNRDAAWVLLRTGDRAIVYVDPGDLVMGVSEDRSRGRNEFGKVLVKVRERLKLEDSTDLG
ncbi:hypothetical protein DFP72DRAFT_553419 [Ephemerocybe angulata]|uniref:NADAR domain-containing protein n=1 Tax=Ephemerocybe angulata TaxID=980116 RepID=A0A8H6HM81_9AGAR|nr:hypothetical protein DFP72DRAFT_553419 [Tulosesus angulatus]